MVFGEGVKADEQRDREKSEHELRELFPQEPSFIADRPGLSALCPVDGIGQNHETDHGVASGLGQDRDFAGGVRIEGAGGSGFGRIIDS